MENMFKSPKKRKLIKSQTTIQEKAMTYFGPMIQIEENGATVKKYKCLKCERENMLNGNKISNLAGHLQSRHPEIYEKMVPKPKKEPLEFKRLRLLQNAVELVSVNGRPFKLLLDSGYQAGIQNKLAKLKEAGIGINFSEGNLLEIKNHMRNMAEKVRAKIRDEVKGKIMSLMVDIVTKNNRSIIGVSLQYIADGKLRIRSIGMIELKQSHTGKYLAKMIIDRLKMYNIENCQILTITTDNGKNIVKMVRDIEYHFMSLSNQGNNDQLEMTRRALADILNNENDDGNTDIAIEQVLAEVHETTDDEALGILFEETVLNVNQNLLSEAANDIIDVIGSEMVWNITNVNCMAHTIQLVVKDSINAIDTRDENVIKIGREVIKFLRLPSTKHEMNERGMAYNLPRLDCPTRWGSTYIMVRYPFYFIFITIEIYKKTQTKFDNI